MYDARSMPKFRRPLALIIAVVVAITLGAGTRVVAALSTVQLGIDRSNMATEWSIGPPAEPKIYPFTGSYNGAGALEARRLAVLDGTVTPASGRGFATASAPTPPRMLSSSSTWFPPSLPAR